jgi:hypothetical protein
MGITTGSESEQAVKAKRLKGTAGTPRRRRLRPAPPPRRTAAVLLPRRAADPLPRTPLAPIGDAGPPSPFLNVPPALFPERRWPESATQGRSRFSTSARPPPPSAWPPVLTPVVPRPTRCRWACATVNCAHPRSSPTPGLRHSQLRPPTLLLTPGLVSGLKCVVLCISVNFTAVINLLLGSSSLNIGLPAH